MLPTRVRVDPTHMPSSYESTPQVKSLWPYTEGQIARWVLSTFTSRAHPSWRTREKAAMTAPDKSLAGDDLLDAITVELVALHMRYYHREPVTAKTLMLGGDLVACVLGGVYTDVEKTMIELQRTTIVQENRSAFQVAMRHKFIETVERLSGRDVLAFISNHHVGPDMEIELFVLKPSLVV